MNLRLRKNLCFELKIQFKNRQNFGDGGFEFLMWTGDPEMGIFSLTRGFETLFGFMVICTFFGTDIK